MMARGILRVTGPESGVELNTITVGIMIVTEISTTTLNTITATGTVTVTIKERITNLDAFGVVSDCSRRATKQLRSELARDGSS
jgi:hypothetical protein